MTRLGFPQRIRLFAGALWRNLSRSLIGRSTPNLTMPVDTGYPTSRLCPTVALQRVPVRPARRGLRVR